ncbi:hypothetical protein DJ84_15525 [Halorubrum ezzemoulense]|nr:hypothetical protein DJ84_15525 [Halorubrum ezzemoulense]
MSANPSGAIESPGTDHGGIVLNGDSNACPGCGQPLPSHGYSISGPGGRATLSPCGLDVSGVPLRELLDAIGRDTSQFTDS